MEISELLEQVVFKIGEKEFTYLDLGSGLIITLICLGLYLFIVRKAFPRVFGSTPEQQQNKKRVVLILRIIFFLIFLIGLLWRWELDHEFYETSKITISITTILKVVLIIQFARLLDWFFSRFLIYNYEKSRKGVVEKEDVYAREQKFNEKKISRKVTTALYVLAIILIIQNSFDFVLFTQGTFKIQLSSIFVVVFVFLIAELFAWVITQLVLFSYFRKSGVNLGTQFAVNQLVKYVIYIFAFYISAEALNLDMKVMLGGMAALLVGVGLGLQQIFNDLFSGIILLFERTVEIGQMVEVDGMVGTVKQIGLRTSIVETRDNVTVIVPNSKLVSEKVINWSHFDDKVRFNIPIGVAYGSDTALVKKILIQVVKENVYVLSFPAPVIRFINFGESSLDFELYFWSRNFLVIEDIKSDIRFEIDKAFRENNITIPFPQRDVWMKKP